MTGWMDSLEGETILYNTALTEHDMGLQTEDAFLMETAFEKLCLWKIK